MGIPIQCRAQRSSAPTVMGERTGDIWMGCFEVYSQVFTAHLPHPGLFPLVYPWHWPLVAQDPSHRTVPMPCLSPPSDCVSFSRPSSQCWYQAHSRHSINVCWMKEQISGLMQVCPVGLLGKQTGVSPMIKVSVQCRTKFPASGNTKQVVKSELTAQQPCDLMQVAQPRPGTWQRLDSLSARARVKCLIHITSFKIYK